MALQVSALRTREGCNGCGAADACMHTCIYVQCMQYQYATLFTFSKLLYQLQDDELQGSNLSIFWPSTFHRATSHLAPWPIV